MHDPVHPRRPRPAGRRAIQNSLHAPRPTGQEYIPTLRVAQRRRGDFWLLVTMNELPTQPGENGQAGTFAGARHKTQIEQARQDMEKLAEASPTPKDPVARSPHETLIGTFGIGPSKIWVPTLLQD
jgi:hypothetical protein